MVNTPLSCFDRVRYRGGNDAHHPSAEVNNKSRVWRLTVGQAGTERHHTAGEFEARPFAG